MDGPIAGLEEHDGLRSIAAGSFELIDTDSWATNEARVASWGLQTVSLDALPLNRSAPSSTSFWTITEGHFDRACDTDLCSADQCKANGCNDSGRIVFAVEPAP